MRGSNPAAVAWLHRLDSYSNEVFGRSRTLSAIVDECVACGLKTTSPDQTGLCRHCAADRVPETTALLTFAPAHRSTRAA